MPSRRSNIMRRYLIYIITAVITALVMWGCSAADADLNLDTNKPQPLPGRPTVPIKRRPIVPSTKLPRPRVVVKLDWMDDRTIGVELAEPQPFAEVVVRDMWSGEVYTYIFDGQYVEVNVPEGAAEIEVFVGDEHHVYTVEE